MESLALFAGRLSGDAVQVTGVAWNGTGEDGIKKQLNGGWGDYRRMDGSFFNPEPQHIIALPTWRGRPAWGMRGKLASYEKGVHYNDIPQGPANPQYLGCYGSIRSKPTSILASGSGCTG